MLLSFSCARLASAYWLHSLENFSLCQLNWYHGIILIIKLRLGYSISIHWSQALNKLASWWFYHGQGLVKPFLYLGLISLLNLCNPSVFSFFHKLFKKIKNQLVIYCIGLKQHPIWINYIHFLWHCPFKYVPKHFHQFIFLIEKYHNFVTFRTIL